MVRHYLARFPGSSPLVVYGVDTRLFTARGLSSNSYRLFFPFLGDPVVREYVKVHCRAPGEYALRRLVRSSRYSDVTLSLALRGHLRRWDNLKRGQVDPGQVEARLARRPMPVAFDADAIARFEETLAVVERSGGTLVLLHLPALDLLNRRDPDARRRAAAMFRAYAAGHPHVRYLDYDTAYEHDHRMFYDALHMNPHGQRVVTDRLARDLAPVLGEGGRG
jgi:hypothetical protein